MTNKRRTVLYIGVTSDLAGRVWQHKTHVLKGFTDKYKVEYLVYYETFETIQEAILREKFLKGKKRSYKDVLVNIQNPERNDLAEGFYD